MKRIICLICLFITVSFSACKKDIIREINFDENDSLIESAIDYLKVSFNENINEIEVGAPLNLMLNDKLIGLKFNYKNQSAGKFILLQKVEGKFIGNKISIPNVSNSSNKYNGIISLESLKDHKTTKLNVRNSEIESSTINDQNGKQIYRFTKNDLQLHYKDQIIGGHTTLNLKEVVLPEVVITVYVEGRRTDFWSMYWLCSLGSAGFRYYTSAIGNTSFSSRGGGSGSGGHSSGSIEKNNVTASPQFISPDTPIENIAEELKCFTSDATSKYSVSININQPTPNSRDVVNPASAFLGGHVFLTLQQTNSDGTSIVRNVGFYPKNMAKPGGLADESIFGEDSKTPFNVTLKISITGSEMQTINRTLVAYSGRDYNLNYFNCANSAIGAMQAIDIILPQTRFDGSLFNGVSPADLGQDIQEINLDNFKAQNPGRTIERNASSAKDLKTPGKSGGC